MYSLWNCQHWCVYTYFNIFLSPCFDILSTWYFVFQHYFNIISTLISTLFQRLVQSLFQLYFNMYFNFISTYVINMYFNISYFNVFNPPGSLMVYLRIHSIHTDSDIPSYTLYTYEYMQYLHIPWYLTIQIIPIHIGNIFTYRCVLAIPT
jgi:hypothetical protein